MAACLGGRSAPRPSPLHGVGRPRSARGSPSRLHAHATTSHHGLSRTRHTRERVLRYPSGETRYIRYPVEATLDEDEDDVSSSWDVVGLGAWRGQARPKQAVAVPGRAAGPPGQPPAPSLANTAAYLEGLFAASYEAQPLVDVDHSYQLLQGCPWVLPRAVFVLAAKDGAAGPPEADIRAAFTLRTKVVQEGAADALAKLLKKQHLASALEVAEMRDGVVAFESDEDADRFAGMLEEEGHSQVLVAEVDSHKLFRMASDTRALVVLMRQGAPLPAPYQLAASLKQKRSWDSL